MELNGGDEMFQVFISGYHLANVSHGKPYYVYTIEMIDSINGSRYLIEKRYSEFNSLHHILKKDSHTAPFPPKKVRNSNPKVLEQRRAALEIYIQKMLKVADTQQQVLNFLGVSDETSKLYQKEHHPVLIYHCDPYVNANENTSLPDIVTNGVLLGIYKS